MLRLIWLGSSNSQYWSRWGERFGFSSINPDIHSVIWIHAVSVGEVKAASILINRLLSKYPRYRILITTVTPSGAGIARKIYGDKVVHVYLPYDLPHAVRRFIRQVKPLILVVMETEIWPNLFHYCSRQGVRIILLNARISARSYKGYRAFTAFTGQVLANISTIAAQTVEDGQRLISLGADPSRVIITGNLKFDINIPASINAEAAAVRRLFSTNRPVWIAASTHAGEEELILAAHRQILETHTSCLLVIAPRHPERFKKVAELSAGEGFITVCKSKAKEILPEVQVFILDSIGELLVYYAAADVAFVGGSLVPLGGHNVLEPASLGIPVITGCHTLNFREINQLLLTAGAIISVDNGQELAVQVSQLLADGARRHLLGQAGKQVVEQNRGSVDRIMDLITENLLHQTNN